MLEKEGKMLLYLPAGENFLLENLDWAENLISYEMLKVRHKYY